MVPRVSTTDAGYFGRRRPAPTSLRSTRRGTVVSVDVPRHHRRNVAVGLAVTATLLAFAILLYNTIRYDADSFRGDQWFWMTNLLLPWENGQQSLWDTVTYEYEPLAHSHIPTFAVLLINARLFGLDTTVDTVIGVLSLVGVFAICRRHVGGFRASGTTALTLAAIASIVFMTLAASNLIWSLLHLQMLYITVAVAYMWSFGNYVRNPRWWWPVVMVPVAMVIGDAAGVAAVVSSLIYCAPLLLLRRIAWRDVGILAGSSAFTVLVIGNILRGQKGHGGEGPLEFAWTLITDPVEPLHSFYLALSQAFVGLHHDTTGWVLIRWDVAPIWFAFSVVLIGAAAWGLWRGGLDDRDHFPILLVIGTLFWTLGVVRSRVWFFGPELTMQQPRYAVNTTLLGIGVLLILLNKRKSFGRARGPLTAALGVIIAANLLGSLTVTVDDDPELVQDREIAALRAWVVGERENAPILGLACSQWAPCLEAGSYLWAEGLGPFRGEPPPPTWYAGFRDAVYDRYNETDDADKPALCSALANAEIDVLVEDIHDPDGLAPWLRDRATVVPADAETDAATFTQRAMDSSCLSFSLFSEQN